MSKRVSKTIHYRHAKITDSELTLQQLLENAFTTKDLSLAVNRQEMPNSEEKDYRLINNKQVLNKMFFGQFIHVRPGESQPIMTVDDSATSYAIEAILPSSLDKKEAERAKKEFVNAILYFGVMDNHVVIAPSTALTPRELETHLFWLIGSKAELLEKTSILLLQNQPAKSTIEKLEKSPVRNIEIGAPIGSAAPALLETDENDNQSTETKMINVNTRGVARDVLKQLIPIHIFNDHFLKDSLDESNLQLNIRISYSRKTDSKGQKALDGIATALRHMDDADVKIHLKGGGTIQGNELKLSKVITYNLTNSGLVDESDLFTKMRVWLIEQIKAEEVEVD
ncbi:hypothetical protein [Oligella sp. HMSC09E12]|uniref:hypothetical protein n=1 Tax=Oligella sp. HMSC09E12 TaxID=1581147 RepID=UPI0008A495DF|nr:hypothetical protein [Oligella sp. HMSC09E12]OFV47332.1 hypothetical protein HMPREF3179_08550 [Oligella sp. HMSC09E12]